MQEVVTLKTVLITGGTRGLGLAIAYKFASNNYNLVLNYVSNDGIANKVKDEIINKYGVEVLLIKADVSKEEDVKKIYFESINKFGFIDCVVNNAGIAIDTTLEDKTVENFKRILDVNLVGPFLISKYFGKNMVDNQKGSIVNIASTNGIDTYYPESMDYDASKAGLINLTKNFANVFSPYVRVNAVASGWINTDMNKDMDIEYKKNEESKILLNRFAEPMEIANVVYFLASDEASYITGSIIRVDGGVK